MAATEYTDQDVERALFAMIAFGGSPSQAARALKDAFDLDVPTSTLRTWRDSTHAKLYAELRGRHAHDIEDAITRDLRDIAQQSTATLREALELTYQKMNDTRYPLRATEAAQIAASLAKVAQTSIDKVLALTGRPQTITENRSAADIMRALAAKGVIALEPATE